MIDRTGPRPATPSRPGRAIARLAVLALLLGGLAACDPYPETCAVGPVLRFDPGVQPMVVPFPSDLFTVEDPTSATGIRLELGADTPEPFGSATSRPVLLPYTRAMNRLDGFSTLANLYAPVGAAPAPESLAGSVVLMVADPTSPADGERVPVDLEWHAPDLHVVPRVPLRERTRYAMAVTRALSPARGSCYRASVPIRALWGSWSTGVVGPGQAHWVEALDALDARGVDPASVLSVARFTTGWVTRGLDRAVAVLDARADADPPSFRDWEIVPHPDPRLRATAHATFDVPVFLRERGGWRFDVSGTPIVDHVETLRAHFSLPAADAHPDGQPYPILMFEHGIMSSKYEMRPPFTTEAAARGFATVAIDAVCHGERNPGEGDVAKALCFYDVLDPPSLRDNFRESVANVFWLELALESLRDVDLDGNQIPDFDVDRIYNLGLSFGGMLAGTYAGLESSAIQGSAITASGGKLSSFVDGGSAAPIVDLLQGIAPITDLVIFGMVQAVLDPADPANYVRRGAARASILQQGSAFDEVVGGDAGAWLARAGGWPQVEPIVWDAGVGSVPAPRLGSGYYHFDTSDHTLIYGSDPTGIAAREQVLHFFETARDTGTGEIIDPLE